MEIHPLWLILFALIAILPSLVVAVFFSSRFEALRGDVAVKKVHLDGTMQQLTDKLDTLNVKSDTAKQAFEIADLCKVKLTNLEESFTALSNKWNSRERIEKRDREKLEAARRKEEEMQQEYEIPGTEQQSFLPTIVPPQQQPTNIIKSKRKFGSLP